MLDLRNLLPVEPGEVSRKHNPGWWVVPVVSCQAGLALIGHLQHAQPSWVLGASAVEFQFKDVGSPTLGPWAPREQSLYSPPTSQHLV